VIKYPQLFADSAIFVTFDEGGGYYDSGYIQPLDFFGDGTRIPLMVISPYVKPSAIDHTYADHASILKFLWNGTGISRRFPSGVATICQTQFRLREISTCQATVPRLVTCAASLILAAGA
jgi:phospholipase C